MTMTSYMNKHHFQEQAFWWNSHAVRTEHFNNNNGLTYEQTSLWRTGILMKFNNNDPIYEQTLLSRTGILMKFACCRNETFE